MFYKAKQVPNLKNGEEKPCADVKRKKVLACRLSFFMLLSLV